MLYTSVEKVKQHLIPVFPVRDTVFDQPVILSNSDFVTFFGGAIDSDSLKVKSIQSNYLKKTNITLGSESTSLPDQLLIRETFVAASDSSLGTVYTENVDYIVDYANGRLTIKSGGAFSPGMTIYIWYGYYDTYNNSSDYAIDASNGKIRRTANGDITSGETVYLDYQPLLESFNDVIIQNAVDEANALIEKTIDPDQQFGVEPVLQTAATYRAVEIVSRASASRELSSLRGEHNVALTWIKLAEEYSSKADKLIESFRAPFSGPSSPTHT